MAHRNSCCQSQLNWNFCLFFFIVVVALYRFNSCQHFYL
uniref:Uncharacterized protein n=1 Tax=Rhizophora mucronata TaxID=61149 RepID=A0A2P2QBE0_RHIMU